MAVPGSPTGADDLVDDITEFRDATELLDRKVQQVAALIRKTNHVVVHTGAGISTSAKIPDYRGPQGVWTCRDQGKRLPKMPITLDQARPTPAHMAITSMIKAGCMKYVVSTNLDGLHRRSGVSGTMLSELHGNAYREKCDDCGRDYVRPFQVKNSRVQFIHVNKHTGRLCERILSEDEVATKKEAQSSGTAAGGGGGCGTDGAPADAMHCRGKLTETCVNFGEYLPPDELKAAEQHSTRAGVNLVLGTSMRVQPACNLPTLGGALVIVNLQRTPYDSLCASRGVRVFAECDEFMTKLTTELGLSVPEYVDTTNDQVVTELERLIQDPEWGTGMKKYNVMSMSDDGPPPPAVLEQIKTGFAFRRHVVPVVKTAPLVAGGDD